jgi:hypothetical protein
MPLKHKPGGDCSVFDASTQMRFYWSQSEMPANRHRRAAIVPRDEPSELPRHAVVEGRLPGSSSTTKRPSAVRLNPKGVGLGRGEMAAGPRDLAGRARLTGEPPARP